MLTPDGVRYFAMAEKRVARPFHLRWLLPKLFGKHVNRWQIGSHAAIVAIGILSALYCHSIWMAAVAFLPGIALGWRHPVLVDPVGMAVALGAAVLWPHCLPAALALVLIAACIRETTPIWVAIYAWNPLALIGLIPVGVRALIKQGPDVLDEQNAWILKHPFKASQMFHQSRWLDPSLMLLPWGGLVTCLGGLDWQLGAALAAGYGQMVVATDSVRLYQWAAPVVALVCVHVLPQWALPFVALSILFNPWKGTGL